MAHAARCATLYPRSAPDRPASRSDGTTRVSIEQRQNCVITIVEVKYAPDPDIQKAARTEALEQHTDLVKSLKARGWKNTTVYPVIIGNAGTITNTAHSACEALGIQAAARITLLRALSIDSVRRTAAIWQPRLAKPIGQQPEPVDVPVPEPQQTTPDPGPDIDQDQQDPQPPGPPAGTACCPDEPGPSAAAPSKTQSDPGERDVTKGSTMDTAAPVDPNAWQTVTNKRNRPRQQPCSPIISPGRTTPGQSRPAKRNCNSFAVLADPPASSDPGVRAVDDAGVAETAAAAHTSRIAGGDSPVRPHSMTLRPKQVSGLRATAAAARPKPRADRKTSRQVIHQRVSNRQRAARQQTARSADSQSADSQSASQQPPADSQQQTRSKNDKSKAAPRTDPLSRTAKRKCPPTLVSDRPLTRQRVFQAGLQHTVRQKRKRRDPQCVAPYRRRTRQCIADRESCDSKQTMRCVPRKLTPCAVDAGVPFDPG